MTTDKNLPILIVAQAIITVAFLIFAYVVPNDTIQNLIVGGVFSHWFSETPRLGRAVNDARSSSDGTSDAVPTQPVAAQVPLEAATPVAATPGVGLPQVPPTSASS